MGDGGDADNLSLCRARVRQQDEFYTQAGDVKGELMHYDFRGTAVYCNCDDPSKSAFVRYFHDNFESLGLRRLEATCYRNRQTALSGGGDMSSGMPVPHLVMRGPHDKEMRTLAGDGDFRSPESVEIMRRSDAVVTNPPFSLFREYIAQLMRYKKKFLIIGNQNAITYKEIFPLIRDNKIWLGHYVGDMTFRVPAHYEPRPTRYWQDETGQKWRSLGTACWFTNLDIMKRHAWMHLYRKYRPGKYPKYDNYDAINVDIVADIPEDYEGAMGVPITFLDRYNPDQFEILDANTIRRNKDVPYKEHGLIKDKEGTVEGGSKPKYVRIVIRARRRRKA